MSDYPSRGPFLHPVATISKRKPSKGTDTSHGPFLVAIYASSCGIAPEIEYAQRGLTGILVLPRGRIADVLYPIFW